MKNIAFLFICFTFSISVSAHQQTKIFNKEVTTKVFVLENSEAYTTMYTGGNGGIIQLIYNAFYKLGNIVSSSLDTNNLSNENVNIVTEN